MARRSKKVVQRHIGVDPCNENVLYQMIVNRLMKRGRKELAYRLLYRTLSKVYYAINEEDPEALIAEAVRNVTPSIEVKAKRRGGATFQVPVPVTEERGTNLAISWILAACRKRSGRTMVDKLSSEFLDASKNLGAAIRKKEEVMRMAESNRVNAPAGRF